MRAHLLGPILCALACGRDPSPANADTSTGTVTAASTWAPDTASGSGEASDSSSGHGSGTAEADSGEASSTGAPPDDGPLALYVASGTDVHHFAVDPSDGTPMPVEVITVGEDLGPMTRRGSRLYAGDVTGETVHVLSIDTEGALTSLGSTTIDMQPVYLAFTSSGSHLLVADYGGNRIASFPAPGDELVMQAASQRMVGQNPHAIVPAPDGAFVFVPHLGSGEIRQFRYDDRTGELSPNDPSQVDEPTGGARHLVFDATATHAYVSNEVDDSITTWDYDAVLGRLSNPRTISTLPGGMSDDGNTVAELRLTPDGRFLYVSNRGHDSLAIFAVEGGELVAQGHAATAPTPRAFTIEPGGRFIYVGGLADGSLATHVIADDGSLARGVDVDVAPAPMWIEAMVL